MGSNANKVPKTPLKIVFLTFPIAGHMLHIVDTASTFAMHGVACTLITTHANVPFIQKSMSTSNPNIKQLLNLSLLDFPYEAVDLPPGIENFSSVTSQDMRPKISKALSILQKPTEDLIKEISPDCIVSDMFYPWTSDFAVEIGVPRVVFRGCGMFPMCCWHSVKTNNVSLDRVEEDGGIITLSGLPHHIEMRKSTLPDWVRKPSGYTYLMKMIDAAELKSHGVIVNSFSGLEGEYEEYYKKVTGLKVWTIGPISLHVGRNEELDGSSEWVKWLDRKQPRTVIYVSFGGVAKFPPHQLREIAAGLESSGCDFVWVVRANETEIEGWSLEKFKEKMRESGQGLIIEGWVPQLMFLEHKSIGGMVTHVGWGTMLEGITAGLPLVTWPLYAEQFYNERLVVDVLKIGVGVGVTEFCGLDDIGKKETIGRESIEAAVRLVMGKSEEANAMRRRVKELSEASKKAVEDGGSSKANIQDFLDELTTLRSLRDV